MEDIAESILYAITTEDKYEALKTAFFRGTESSVGSLEILTDDYLVLCLSVSMGMNPDKRNTERLHEVEVEDLRNLVSAVTYVYKCIMRWNEKSPVIERYVSLPLYWDLATAGKRGRPIMQDHIMYQGGKHFGNIIDDFKVTRIMVRDPDGEEHYIKWNAGLGYVHMTSIWKALGRGSFDLQALLATSPPQLRKDKNFVRLVGGRNEVKGTWAKTALAFAISRRVAYHMKDQLVAIFGHNFPDACLLPNDPCYGRIPIDSSDYQNI